MFWGGLLAGVVSRRDAPQCSGGVAEVRAGYCCDASVTSHSIGCCLAGVHVMGLGSAQDRPGDFTFALFAENRSSNSRWRQVNSNQGLPVLGHKLRETVLLLHTL